MVRALFLMLIFSLVAVAQDQPGTDVGNPKAKPKLMFEKPDFDFGQIEQGAKVDYTFKFKNVGDADLEIKDVKPTCGCTTAKPSKLVYKPGESGEIPVTFDSARFAGSIVKTVMVISNDPEKPRSQLKITGKIRTEITVEPRSVAMPSLKRGETLTREIKVTTEVMDKLEVSELSSSLDFVGLGTEQVDDKTVVIKVTVDGSKVPTDRDVFQGNISYKTNATKTPEGKTGVFIRMTKPIQARPGSVYFFSTPKGKAREMEVALQPTEDQKMKILGVESDLDFISVEVTDESGRLKVTLTDGAQVGKFNGHITVKTDVKSLPSLRIPVRGSVI